MIYNRKIIIIVLCVFFQAISGFAGLRTPGKYAGILIFDRWDGCVLYSGIYLMYVSEKVKESIRPYTGQAILIDAKQVWQPSNPGDGRISSFRYLGVAPEYSHWVILTGITFNTSAEIDTNGKVIATISIKNTGNKSVKIFSRELALTLLIKSKYPKFKHRGSPTDSPSFALITRRSFYARWQGKGVIHYKPYSWTIGKENALPRDFILDAGKTQNIRIHFDLPPGEYDFLSGYGGGVHEGKGLASNLTAFDIDKDGKAEIVTVKGRN